MPGIARQVADRRAVLGVCMPTLPSRDETACHSRTLRCQPGRATGAGAAPRAFRRTVLVRDGICTTGTQLDTVAGCLLGDGGAIRVEGIVLVRAPWRG